LKTKICIKCKEEKILDKFEKDERNFKDKKRNVCKKCRNSQRNKIGTILRRKYGISLETKNILLEAQKNKCAICKNEFTETNKAQIDHDHKTGCVRELLCGKCNRTLGMADDSVILLVNCIQYLLKHSGIPE
jgi:Autographiviridae endonuclease VII